jgi:SAM-dependent methyltransferase
MENENQTTSGLRAILSSPLIYNTFQRVIGVDSGFRKYVNEIIKPTNDSKILDIGCGEGYILNFLPTEITYVGYDMDSSYIEYARKKYKERGTFFNTRVNEMPTDNFEQFDIVLATGLLHHLGDDEAGNLFKLGHQYLKKGGVMFTYDNCYFQGQSPIARYISSKDRGKNVRYPEGYKKLATVAFNDIETIIRHDMIRIPQSVCILKCHKN